MTTPPARLPRPWNGHVYVKGGETFITELGEGERPRERARARARERARERESEREGGGGGGDSFLKDREGGRERARAHARSSTDVQSAVPRFLFVRGSARLLRGPSDLKTSVG